MQTMRAIVVERPGGPEELKVETVPEPQPRPHELRVRVRAFGINRADLLQRRGLYPAPPGTTQNILGLEYSGVVDAVGSAVRGRAVGEPVMGIVAGGSYAEYVLTPADHTMPVADTLSVEQSAAIPEAYLTGYDALEQLQVEAGEWVLIHAVGSGVGTATVQLVRARGAHCVGTSRTAEKLRLAAGLGLDFGVDTSSNLDLRKAIKQGVGGEVNAVVDLIGGKEFGSTLRCLAPGGRALIVGLTAGDRAEIDLGLILRNRLVVRGTVLRTRSDEEKTKLVRSFVENVLPWFGSSGKLQPTIDRVFRFDQVPEAHRYVEENGSFGKVIVRVD
jgi:NADPH:quinone reductase